MTFDDTGPGGGDTAPAPAFARPDHRRRSLGHSDLVGADGEIGYLHSVETAGTVDGPGVRFVVFLTGCTLRCQYCHNPDCLHLKDGYLVRADDLIAEIGRYAKFLKRARGGVTVTGGEPLVQAAFTTRLLEGAKGLGLHTALDTSGHLGALADDRLLAATDLVLLDIKGSDPDTYRETTGRELAPTLTFADRLGRLSKPVWVRFVLVPGLTDDPDNIRGVADICAAHPNIERVDVLPFHQMGAEKWEQLGMTYTLADTPEPTEAETEAARAIFRQSGNANVR